MTTQDQAMTASLELKLVSVTGYECETTYKAVTPEQWGDVVSVLEGKAKPPTPDCRTCTHLDRLPHSCGIASLRCTNGDQYQPAPRVVLWRTE